MAPTAPHRHSAGYSAYILLLLLAINALSYADRHVFSVLIPAIKAEFGAAARLVAPHLRAQASAMLVVTINVIGSALGPLLGGAASDLLTGHFGAEALRISLLSLSVLTGVGGVLFWRASIHYPRDLAAAHPATAT